jgi:hypothetical protein
MHARLAVHAFHIVVVFSIGIAAAGDPSPPAAGDTASAPHSVQTGLPRVVFQTDFSEDFQYVLPHRFDTSSVAKQLANGVLMVHIRPGMYGASNDKPNRERAEYAQPVPPGTTCRQSFRLRVEPGFSAPKRTLVAQFKPPVGDASPPLSLYLSNGGEVKYVNYLGSDDPSRHDQHHVRLAPLGINLLDGQWHEVSMVYWRSDSDGYVNVTIDCKVIVAEEGYDSNPGGEVTLNARIGIYRDAMPIEQTVMFDDWKVEALSPRRH